MAISYRLKVVVSGKQVEVYEYEKDVWRDFSNKKSTKQTPPPKEATQLDLFTYQERRKQKQAFSLNRTKTEIRRLINTNSQLNKFMTLTFADNITDLDEANYLFNQFIKRMRYRFPSFEYLAVPEFQKRGAVHYHLACALPYVEGSELETIWSHGMIQINRIDNMETVGVYMTKYLTKELFDERFFGKKKFFRSQSLARPVELIGYWATRIIHRFLSACAPIFERTFLSEHVGSVLYRAYRLDSPIFSRDGYFDAMRL